ncbi:MAG: UDP-glucose/GDP-mannose dehydrogenase family protein [Candidatus Latescibacterota bacterium]|nr:UDP-glucose/GDP-mannose dehydrogenase family protein [Candidatus Latescibacterota bacterium]
MKRICVMGTGYVGLVSGACLADFGNAVVCVDIDEPRIDRLRAGEVPIYEPGLEELVARNRDRGRLTFSTDVAFAIKSSDIVFICVGTPSLPSGEVDMSYVHAAARSIGQYTEDYKIVVNKSTVPVGTGDEVGALIAEVRPDADIDVVSNPEFLREGSAIDDFMHPDRVVIGASSRRALEAVIDVYRPLYQSDVPMVLTDVQSAEMIKYASNAMLAAKISFINEIANICEAFGADVTAVARGMGLDKRIGPRNLYAGAGYGGSCFPKDVQGLAATARKAGVDAPLVQSIDPSNVQQRRHMIDKLRDLIGSFDGQSICLLGLSFKPDTDDLREAPAMEMIEVLLGEGASVRAYDPVAMEHARAQFPDLVCFDDPYAAAAGADVLVLMTEWNEFRNMDLPRIQSALGSPRLLDCRNVYDPREMAELGFDYVSVGRPRRSPGDTVKAAADWIMPSRFTPVG